MASFLNIQSAPRGIRNNNPGNLVITANNWKGKVPVAQNTDGHFEQFYEVENGIRAMAYDIYGDIKQGTNTLTKLINEYAPASDGNNTNAYIAMVAEKTGLKADASIILSEHVLFEIIKAKISVENGLVGLSYVTDAMITEGINRLPASYVNDLKKKI
jgi:hypothetical protein